LPCATHVILAQLRVSLLPCDRCGRDLAAVTAATMTSILGAISTSAAMTCAAVTSTFCCRDFYIRSCCDFYVRCCCDFSALAAVTLGWVPSEPQPPVSSSPPRNTKHNFHSPAMTTAAETSLLPWPVLPQPQPQPQPVPLLEPLPLPPPEPQQPWPLALLP
jgi:hypothetical protein